MKHICYCILFLLLPNLAQAADLIRNGDFQSVKNGKLPEFWSFGVTRNASASMELVPGLFGQQRNAVRIINRSPYEQHVFASLSQKITIPHGAPCELRFFLKGKDVNGFTATYGKQWKDRLNCTGIGAEWKEFIFAFTPAEDEWEPDGSLILRFLSQDVTKEVLLANVRLTVLNMLTPAPETVLYPLRKLPGLPEPAQWPRELPVLRFPQSPAQCFRADGLPQPADLSCEAAAGYCEDGLVFLIRVHDDKRTEGSADLLWQSDSVQLRINRYGHLGEEEASDLELGFGLANGVKQNWSWTAGRELTDDELTYSVTPLDDGYQVNALLRKKLIPEFLPGKTAVSFNLVVNDNDGNGRKVVFLAPGIHEGKSSAQNVIALADGNASAWFVPSASTGFVNLDGRLLLTGGTDKKDLQVVVTDHEQRVYKQSIPSAPEVTQQSAAESQLSIALGSLAPGALKVQMVSAGQVLQERSLQKADPVNDARTALASVQTEYDALCRQADLQKATTWRVNAIRQIAPRQIELLSAELTKPAEPAELAYYAKRGQRICDELKYLCSEFRAELEAASKGAAPQPIFPYVSSPRQFKDGWFYAQTSSSDGSLAERPVVFSGYGHFTAAQKDIPNFPALQMNTIQMEFGPRSVITAEAADGSFRVDTATITNRLNPLLAEAWKNNGSICILLSPHYFPGWALKAHPEVADDSGFLKYRFMHPYAKRLIEAYLRAIIPALRDLPSAQAIHSLCLSNEPIFFAKLSDPFYRDLFKQWLLARHGNLDGINRAYGIAFTSLEEALPVEREPNREDKGLYYDFLRWRMEALADWHAWMAGIIKEQWPSVKVHAKIMMGAAFSSNAIAREAVDPELYAPFCDLNGNDDYFIVDRDTPRGWIATAAGYALQTSLRRTHVVNSENHIISDRFDGAIPYERIYTSIFQQFAHGCAGSMIWLWENSSYPDFMKRGDAVGSIYRRPAAILAATDATADANRVAPELHALFRAEPEIALLYSPASNIMDPVYGRSVYELFAGCAAMGRKCGFVSENQLRQETLHKLKVILLPSASYVHPETIEALNAFRAAGGVIVRYGECLNYDPYGKPLATAATLKNGITLTRRDDLLVEMRRQVLPLLSPIPVEVTSEKGLQNVDWCVVPDDKGGWLLSLTNYNSAALSATLKIPASWKATDRIRGLAIESSLSIRPYTPLLLTISRP